MENKADWNKFRESGLLWFVNRSLYLFGWVLVYVMDEAGDLVTVFPTRTKYRGFTEEAEDKGFKDLTKYLKETANDLEKDLED